MRSRNEDARSRPSRPVARQQEVSRAGADALIGRACDDLTVLETIARGGFGTVYQAWSQRQQKPVALKVLHAEMAQFPDAIARFQREARAVNLIRHPNVVEIFDFGTLADRRPYFTMELLAGEDLDTRLERVNRLSAVEIVELLVPLCDALGAAHAAGVVHRDVKPSNVFLVSEPAPRVVLLDFGIAKILNNDPSLTSSRHALGTPAAMAPEQIRGDEVDERTDVYALGALVYRAATGELPFYDPSAVVTHHMHLFAERPRPSALAPACAALDPVVLRAMARDPAERYTSVAAMLAAARRAIGDSTETASVAGVGVYLERFLPDGPLDPTVLDLAEEALDGLRHELEEVGMAVAMDTGNAILLVAGAERAAAAIARVLTATERWQAPHERVHVNVCIGAGSLERTGDEYTGGDLLHVDEWVPRAQVTGVASPSEAARILELEAGPGGLSGFVRVLSSRG